MYNAAYNVFTPLNDIHYYQGVLLVEVALTLIVFFVLRIIHYIKWGYDQEQGNAEEDPAPSAEKKSEKKEGEEEQPAGQSKKWDQKAWNVYFPIMFSLHVGAISIIILYIPLIFSAVIGFLHFLCFLVLVVLNICIKDAEPGNGSRTKGTRVVWGFMGLFNIMLIVGGLTGVSGVYG